MKEERKKTRLKWWDKETIAELSGTEEMKPERDEDKKTPREVSEKEKNEHIRQTMRYSVPHSVRHAQKQRVFCRHLCTKPTRLPTLSK